MNDEQKNANDDNHANQLNKNNPEYGNARNKQNERASEKPTETPPKPDLDKEEKGTSKK